MTQHFIHKVNEEIHREHSFANNMLISIITPPGRDPLPLDPIGIPNVDLIIPDLFNVSGSLGFG